jgi:hypothetical protein
MPDTAEKLRPADPHDLANSIAFALKFEGRKRKHDADEYMAKIAAERVVRHLERAGFVVMKRPPLGGHSGLGRGLRASALASPDSDHGCRQSGFSPIDSSSATISLHLNPALPAVCGREFIAEYVAAQYPCLPGVCDRLANGGKVGL